jgi:hypothetical protein
MSKQKFESQPLLNKNSMDTKYESQSIRSGYPVVKDEDYESEEDKQRKQDFADTKVNSYLKYPLTFS